MSSTLPPVLTGASISGTAAHMVIDLTFNQQIERGSGTIIVTDGALQTVIDRSSGLPVTRVVGATQTYQVPLSMVSIDGNTAEIKVDGLSGSHSYRVFILPGVLQSNGQPFAGVTNAAQLGFVTPPAADTTPPALLMMALDKNALSTGKNANLTLTFSESVTIDPSALAGPNVTISGLASNDGGITWHATVTANPGVDASIGSLALDMQKVLDRANNKGVGTGSVAYSIDTKAPTVSSILLAGASPVLSSDATVTVTFSEKVDLSGPTSQVIVAPHASVTGLHTIDGGTTWVANLVPQSGTIASGNQLYVDLGQVRDLAGNVGAGVANAGTTYIVDTQGPGFKDLSLNGAILSQGRTIDVTIHLQQAISVFGTAALKAPNATVENLHTTDDGHTWIATLRGTTSTSVSHNTLSLDMSLLRDANGVAGSGVIDTPNAYGVDTVAPTATLALTGAKVSAQSSVTVTITFSETVQSLDPAAIKAPNASVTDLASADGGRTWVAKLVPNTDSGTASGKTISLDMSMVRDLAGNAGAGSVNSSTTYGVDTQAPTAGAVSLSDSHVTSTSGPTMTVKFSEPVSLDATAFTLPHAKLTGLHSDDGITWTGTLVSDGSGSANGNTVSLDLSKVKDLYGNAGNGTVASGNYDVQVTAPTATITLGGNQLTTHTAVSVTVVFSQAVTSLTAAAFSTQAGVVVSGLSSSDGGITWAGTLSTNASIQAIHNVFSLDLGKVQDVFGNVGSGIVNASTQYDIDTVAPTATLVLSSSHLTPAAGATLTITFSEAVKPLDPSWFTTPHAQLSGLTSTDNKTWTGTLAAAAGADFSGNVVSLDMSKVADLAGNNGSGNMATATSYDVTHPPAQSVTLALDQAALASGSNIVVTMHFNIKVPTLDLNAITTPNVSLTDLRTTDGGFTWFVTLAPQADAVVAQNNAVSVDLGKVVDINGATGSGIVQSANYAVDTTVAAYVQSIVMVDDNGPSIFDFVTNDATPTFGGVLSVAPGDKQHVEVSIDGKPGGTVYVSGSSWAYPQPTTAPALLDGTHTVSVRVVDDAGHASTQLTKTLTIDTVAPHVTGTSITGGSTTVPGTADASKPLTISFSEQVYWHAVPTLDMETHQTVYRDIDNTVALSDSLGNTYRVYIDAGNLSADGKTLTLPAGDLHLAAGLTYNLALPQALTDLAGNLPDTTAFTFQVSGTYVDTTPPSALSAQVINEMGEYGIGQVIHIAVRFNEAVQLKSGTPSPSLALNNGTHANYTGASDDGRTLFFDYKISANDAQPTDNPHKWIGLADARSLVGAVTDLAGNALDAAHIQFTGLTNPLSPLPGSGISIDATPPLALSAPLLDPASDSGVKGDFITNHPVIIGSGAEPDAWINLYDVSNDSPIYLGGVSADATGHWSITDPLHVDGTYKLAATQQDSAGNASPMSAALSLVRDTYAAGPNDIHVANSYSPINLISAIKTPTLVGKGMEPGATVNLYEGMTLLGTGVVDSTGAWSITTGILGEGTHSIALTQTDIVGNVGHSPGFPLVIDLTAPAQLVAPVLDPGSDSGTSNGDRITNITRPLFTGSGAEPNSAIELYEGATLLGSATSDGSGNWQVKPNADHALIDGVHALSVRQVDAAGNAGAKSAALSITIDTIAPDVASWTADVTYPGKFQLWFTEPVVHSGLANIVNVSNLSGELFKYSLGDDSLWTDGVLGNGTHASVLNLQLPFSGAVDVILTGLQDVAGNAIATTAGHYSVALHVSFYEAPFAVL